ncbi:S-adenosyl-L-methionine-dependent methyltransferase [Xylariaceae sp. FL0255]|nr:S-adenosyl-L-methionine-dependent methyltransferase [Xylariaceae sp. FL0255]
MSLRTNARASFEMLADVAEVIDLTGDDDIREPPHPCMPTRNRPILNSKKTFDLNGNELRPGSVVEISNPLLDLYKASFIWIKHIFETSEKITMLRGIALTRTRNLRGRLPRYRNELAMVMKVDEDDYRDLEVQAAVDVSTEDIIRIRTCHFTNADFPDLRDNKTLRDYGGIAEMELRGILTCRWRCLFIYRDAVMRTTMKKNIPHPPVEIVIQHLNANQASNQNFRVPETIRLNKWRGGRARGGDHESGSEGIRVQVEDDENAFEAGSISLEPGQKYTFGDMFCGAGGASTGARKAGFHVKVGCDNHTGAYKTYQLVFPETILYSIDIFDFMTQVPDQSVRVDVMHLSPPCQFWSPAHTVAGHNDEANIAVLFSCRELIKKLKPRIFTLEQTFGILHSKFEYYFNALVHGFTQHDYSVRWKVMDLVAFGSPARRQRLLMIGACPGEDLPPFPEPTHVRSRRPPAGKKTYVTVKNMLAKIPPWQYQWDDLHQPRNMNRKHYHSWNPNITLKRCITTNGGVGNHHPSGRRDFTLREYAMLQTFPVDYPFQTPDRKKQIGNAFPPLVVKALYQHLRRWLEEQDSVRVLWSPIDLSEETSS